MTRRLTTATAATAATAATVLLIGSAASAHSIINLLSDGATDNAKDTHAHHAQHEGEDGHLEPVSTGVDVISSLELSGVSEGGIADLAVHDDHAYLNAWGGAGTCGRNGVHVVDISDLTAPTEVAFIQAKEGSYPGEGAQVISMATRAFTGDVLLTNNESCKPGVSFGGINLYDVTDPTDPQKLAVGFGDVTGNNKKKTTNETHSVFGWTAGTKAYAAMVDNVETTDVDVVDITDPRKPVLIAEYDLAAQFPQILQEGLDEVFLHDLVVKEIDNRQIMSASYWDAGYVLLDVTLPRTPLYLADSQLPMPDSLPADGMPVAPEGNAHQSEFTLDDQRLIGADEDFSPYKAAAENLTDGTSIGSAGQGSDTRPLEDGDSLAGTSVFVGRACPGDPGVPAAPEGVDTVAVVERGVCDFTVKVAAVIEAGGYEAVLIVNRTAADGCEASLGMTVAGDIPTFGVAPRSTAYDLFDVDGYDEAACVAGDGSQQLPIGLGATGDVVEFSVTFDGWGYVRLFDTETMTELDAYAIPESRDSAYADGYGDLSVHEVATSLVDTNLAYISYYSGGLRVIDVADDRITEVGAFIDEGGNNFWGVEAFLRNGVEYVALSDRDKGLYIVRYTGTP